MMRSLQAGSPHRRQTTWLWMLTLLCISMLFCASTAQACHAHGRLLQPAGDKAQISAPVDECPLCAAPHVALAATTATTVEETPQQILCLAGTTFRPYRAHWSFELFSRPPPLNRAS